MCADPTTLRRGTDSRGLSGWVDAKFGYFAEEPRGDPFLRDSDPPFGHVRGQRGVPRHIAHPAHGRAVRYRVQVVSAGHMPWCRTGPGHDRSSDAQTLAIEVAVIVQAGPGRIQFLQEKDGG